MSDVTLSGSVGIDAGVRVTEIDGLNNMHLTVNLDPTDNTLHLLGDSTKPVTTESTVGGIPNQPLVISIGKLPTIKFAMKPTRIHFPVHLRFGLNILGVELMGFSVCGESMVVIHDYKEAGTECCQWPEEQQYGTRF